MLAKYQKINANSSLHIIIMNSTQIIYMDKTLRLLNRSLHYYFGSLTMNGNISIWIVNKLGIDNMDKLCQSTSLEIK